MVSEVQKIVFVVMTPQVLVLSAGRSMFERIISADKIKNKGLLWDSDEKKKNNTQVLRCFTLEVTTGEEKTFSTKIFS